MLTSTSGLEAFLEVNILKKDFFRFSFESGLLAEVFWSSTTISLVYGKI